MTSNMVGLPPVIPKLEELIENYILNPELLPIHDPKYARKFWPQNPKPRKLFSPSLNPAMTKLVVERDPASGLITGVQECAHSSSGSTSKNSFSLQRIPGPPEEAVRGSSTNYPFWPGGIAEPITLQRDIDRSKLFEPHSFLKKHPMLSCGMEFSNSHKQNLQTDMVSNNHETVNLSDMLTLDKEVLNLFDIVKEDRELVPEVISEETSNPLEEVNFDDALPCTSSDVIVLRDDSSPDKFEAKTSEWAEIVNIHAPVDDFKTRVPNPACSYPFELDTFQKQAVLHMENQESVFVAAHTSAGKTVVAEYAIALSLKHMTRSIYTSPIKALSNQKYRDLKQKFEDVGLLTGDIQINTKASCLIMTTEILQSMLYNGSDLIRDLEWVIFDEVHYINNADRGHVWEEVLIMLPAQVNIVLLSATVPNTLMFADWIGRIKKKKIYVISTTKRPVPLQHFLYTGCGGKTKDERFMIVGADGKFLTQGYAAAVAAKKEREKKSQQTHGARPGQRQTMGDKQEKTTWIGLIDHLRKKDLLPVVAFTLSKKRCDRNASQLDSQDLTTAREKGLIHAFIKKCTDRLQGTDKQLPQVVHMTHLLKNGIGVHHSGILPILKEVVEMLFAKGLVKLLFATETFAMGVNMPARSVVFDSVRKHDGTKFRDLVPSEYIQMAGRAGRRGIDTTGTVIILCKIDIPEISDLHKMMLGKPSKLESQFKLTYSMILNLLRVEALRVEDMMKRSFSESLQMINQSKYEQDLVEHEAKLAAQQELDCIMCSGIEDFYALSKDYAHFRSIVYQTILSVPSSKKFLQPGRIIVISSENLHNYLACVMKLDNRDPDKLSVFILQEQEHVEVLDEKEQQIRSCLSTYHNTFEKLGQTSYHDIVNITVKDIAAISKKLIKLEADKIIGNVNNRKIPRFRVDPPSKCVVDLVLEMQRLNEAGPASLIFLDFGKDLSIKDFNCLEELLRLGDLHTRLISLPCLECPQFRAHFTSAFHTLQLREEVGRLKYLVSEESLMLHPDYKMRTEVLKRLNYLQDNNTVTLKGRVACEMGNHELMVTELLLENVFAEKPVEEDCALLSSLVFQQKNCSAPMLTTQLQQGIEQFKTVAQKIGQTQRDCGLKEAVGDYVDQFNFGLTEVVYQWALGMPFNNIMELTDVQEGITVKCIQRLDETLRDVRNAARIIGDPAIYEKMEKASACIKRDIVFAASLYTQ